MRLFPFSFTLLLFVTGTSLAVDDDPEPPQPDKGKFVGEWDLVDIKLKGLNVPLPPGALQVKITFHKDGTMTSDSMGRVEKGKWKIDPSKKPKHLDLTGMNNPGQMIYKFDKDQLTLGSDQNGQQRPKDFESAQAIMVLKRAKKK